MRNSATVNYLYGCIARYPGAVLVMVGMATIWAFDFSIRPYLMKIIIDRLSTHPDPNTVFSLLFYPSVAYLSMHFILATAFRIYSYVVEIHMIPNLRVYIANHAVDRFGKQSHRFYQNHFSGSLASKINDLTSSVPDIMQIIFDRFLSHSLALLFAIIMLSKVSIFFGVMMFVWVTFFLTGSYFYSSRLAKQAADWASFGAVITGQIVDVLSNILSIRLFTAFRAERRALNRTFDKAVAAERVLEWSYFWMNAIYWYGFFILQALNFYGLCYGYQRGWVTPGDFALVLSINLAIMEHVFHLAREFSVFTKLFGRIKQALREVLIDPEILDASDAKTLHITQGEIRFNSVYFHYNATQALFQRQSVVLKGGQKIGLVGFSGGGKSTFVNLILRLYDVHDGQIEIDGQDIRTVTQASLHRAIAVIPQDPSLFHRTLHENIGYGQENVTLEQVKAAAIQARAHDFIAALPHGYNSLVGERGVKLSGGQRQRIAIARAILKNAPILILDEATSQLDSLTESEIQESLWTLMQDKTTIVIAHRLSTLLHMDRILVFDQGTIVQDGTHQELLARPGLYQKLWFAQVGGFLPDSVES